MILKPEPPSTLWPHAIPAIHIIRAELNETPLEHAWDKPRTEYLLFQNLWSQVTTDGSRRSTKGNKTTNFFFFFFLTKSLISQFWRRKEAYRERKSKKLLETQTKIFCKQQILTEKRSLRSPKKGVTQGFVRWLSVTGLARIKRWATQPFAPTTPTTAPYPHSSPPRRPSLKRKCALPTYIQQQDRLNVLFVGVACSVLWERMFCSLDTHSVHLELLLFSLGTHFMFIEDICSVRWERLFSVHWEFMFCSLGTDVLFVGDTPWTNSRHHTIRDG
jgi:hypothetical protein